MSRVSRKLRFALFAAMGIALAAGVASLTSPSKMGGAQAGLTPATDVQTSAPAEPVATSTSQSEPPTIQSSESVGRSTLPDSNLVELPGDRTVPADSSLGATRFSLPALHDAPGTQQAVAIPQAASPPGTTSPSGAHADRAITPVQHEQPLGTSGNDPRLVNTLLDLLQEARQARPTGPAADVQEQPPTQPEIPSANGAPPIAPATPAAEPLPGPRSRISPIISAEGDDRLQIYIANQELREVLAMLSEQGGLNILPSKSVQGAVSASLNGVTVDQALDAILRSTGYVARREGKFIYVGTPQDFEAMAQVLDRIGTRVYRPNYVTALELRTLITPLLSPPPIGKIQATSPSKVDIGPDSNKIGGDDFAGTDAVLVQDYESVLCAIDQIVAEIDLRPAQVAIEAMILSVRLNDSNTVGVDFQFLRDSNHVRLATGSPLSDLAQVAFNGGLKFAYLDSNFSAFVAALETIGDTNVIATPRLMTLNKQRAEILIGSQLGYVSTSQTETSTTQNVEFLEVGAQLRLRPFIANDGMIRMEVHPELSTGVVKVQDGLTLPDKEVTQVTTNIMVRDGYTVVIGGLMREDITVNTTQVPLLGSLPYVGPLFRTKKEQLEKREIIVLVTPRIVHEPQMYQEGEQAAGEFHRRQSVYADKMSPVGKRYLGRKYFHLAQEAWARREARAALRLASMAVHLDPLNRAAIDLRSDIWAGTHEGDHSSAVPAPLRPGHPLDGPQVSSVLLEQLSRPTASPPPGVPPSDPGRPGYSRRIDPTVQP